MSTRTLTAGPLRARLRVAALVALGGVAGANCRYAAALLAPGLPGTLLANVLGAFALGFLVYGTLYRGALPADVRLLVSTGFLSSFTTYSTFAVQSATARPALLVANVALTYALGFAAVLAGRTLARRITGWSA
ncbi:chromosome condensation protein CrcB [Halarchaeum grantii]|uniref:Fluoride-specific ion channel FluC n=1 Tax=Halarchaeum grantii TaxID=1193105 RepID=A0A830FAI3_9EURY|nr:CrcB family protein [Halarchaeum grantii]GGL27320.1 chromosome condensation protein CrcB [Halarchaeum grantii]